MTEESEKININSAELDELTSLPGIGSNTAEKIIAGRPYSSIEELRQVSGIGQNLFDRIAPLIHTGPVADNVEEESENLPADEPFQSSPAAAPELESIPAEVFEEPQRGIQGEENFENDSVGLPAGTVQESPPAPPAGDAAPALIQMESQSTPEPASEPVIMQEITHSAVPPTGSSGRTANPSKPTRLNSDNKIYGIFLTCGTLAILISTALTLAILFIINNSLSYVQPAELNKIESQIAEVSSQVSSLERDIQTLTARMDNLETIAGRVNNVENEMEKTRSELETMTTRLDSLEPKIVGLDQQVGELEQAAEQFSGFLKGLRDLLGSISLPESTDN